MSGSSTGYAGKPARWGAAGAAETPAGRLRRKFPTFNDLQRRAKWRVARFAYDFVAGGVGDGAPNVAHNRAAMDAVRIVPRYALDVSKVSTSTRLFGKEYAVPVGVAP